jgi:ATP-dependent DNA helicase RecQ
MSRKANAVPRRRLERLLRERFGHEEFRAGQRRIVESLTAGRDVLAVLPTGAGKSLTYQLAAEVLGLTVVVSPLIALMRDQVDGLREHGLPVAMLSSAQGDARNRSELRAALEGRVPLLYLTPERLDDEDLCERLRRAGVRLFTVDEAHEMLDWGESFRPSYLGLGAALERLGRPRVLALTATATPWVREEVVERLGMRHVAVVVRGVDRPNLFLEVLRVEEERNDRRLLEALLRERPGRYRRLAPRLRRAMDGAGIVYTSTTRAAEETAAWLREWGVEAAAYHGRMRKRDRDAVQTGFMEGRLRMIAATNAFGLGVDKPDVRFVVHRDVPASLEAYAQEAGRGGRDGELARCTLLFRPGDLGRSAFLAAPGRLQPEQLEAVLEALRGGPLGREELERRSGLGAAALARVVSLLEREGVVRARRRRFELEGDVDAVEIPLEREEHRHAIERSRVEIMRGYAETVRCRRQYLLNYFGEDYPAQRCRACDNHAAGGRGPASEAPADVPFELGERVRHETFGDGVVQRVSPDKVMVLFESAGYKTLDAALVQAGGVLSAAGDS